MMRGGLVRMLFALVRVKMCVRTTVMIVCVNVNLFAREYFSNRVDS